MTTFRNTGPDAIAFRDDAGKHTVEPGQTFAVAGDQHVGLVETLTVERVEEPEPLPADATVADLRERADALGVTVPAKARKAELEAAVRSVEPEAEGA